MDLSDEEVIWTWNAWVPYTITCHKGDVKKILKKAKKRWLYAYKIWEVKKVKKWDPVVKLSWVWVWWSEITYNREDFEKKAS